MTDIIAGVYITDDYMDLAIAKDKSMASADLPPTNFDVIDHFTIDFHQYLQADGSIDFRGAFKRGVELLLVSEREISNVAIGGPGPFTTLDRNIPVKDRVAAGYGKVTVSIHPSLEGLNYFQLTRGAFQDNNASIPEIQVQTDVAVAALGELCTRYAAHGQWIEGGQDQVVAFLKISLGIGGSVVWGHRLWNGRKHSEMGSIQVARWQGPDIKNIIDEFTMDGVCRFHDGCLEDVASLPAFKQRWGIDFRTLQTMPDHMAWDRHAFYVAQLCVAVTCLFSPGTIVLGGRTMTVQGIVDKVRYEFERQIGRYGENGAYPEYPDMMDPHFIDSYAPQADGAGSGVIGALGLASMMRSGLDDFDKRMPV